MPVWIRIERLMDHVHNGTERARREDMASMERRLHRPIRGDMAWVGDDIRPVRFEEIDHNSRYIGDEDMCRAHEVGERCFHVDPYMVIFYL